MEMTEKLEMRGHGAEPLPTLIYLPGLHGDWTLVGSFRRAIEGRVRFVEVTYPRTLTWSLEDYAEAVEMALAERGITHGWLLGESFSSQVVWPLLARNRFHTEGIILAGGFVGHPLRWGVRLAERFCGGMSLAVMTAILFGYAKFARWRFRKSPEVQAGIREFIARRTELDRQAAKHRLRLVAENDPGAIAREAKVPVYAMTGVIDPVVPWWWVRPWLKKNCPALRDYRIFWQADHNVLGTAAQPAADLVVAWMNAGVGHAQPAGEVAA
jgi:pimeloyl-ACP methyl ester carboxylesterase